MSMNFIIPNLIGYLIFLSMRFLLSQEFLWRISESNR